MPRKLGVGLENGRETAVAMAGPFRRRNKQLSMRCCDRYNLMRLKTLGLN